MVAIQNFIDTHERVFADVIDQCQPGQTGEQRQPDQEQCQVHDRGPDESQSLRKVGAGNLTEDSAGSERHALSRYREMNAGERAARDQRHDEPAPADYQHLVTVLGTQVFSLDQQDTVVDQHDRQQKGKVSEQVEKQIRYPRARGAAEIGNLGIAAAMRPGAVLGVIADHRQQEVTGQRE